MKKVRQAAQKRITKKQRQLFIFYNTEQMIGFFFFLIIIFASIWIIKSVKNWMNDPEQVVLSHLCLTGKRHFTYEDDILKAILGLGLPNTYLDQNVDDIQQEILRLPWIKDASVRKQWPDKLIVNIVEYKPKFYWNDLFLLDKNGNQFSIPLERLGDLPLVRLYGPEGKAKYILNTYNELNAISSNLANQQLNVEIKEAISDERNAWQLIIKQCALTICNDNHYLKLILGNENLAFRYQQFIKLLPEIQSRMPMNEIMVVADLRYENGISIIQEQMQESNN